MKKLIFAIVAFIVLTGMLSSCSKCAVCKVGVQESNKICQKDSRSNYKDSKNFCEIGGGIWVEL